MCLAVQTILKDLQYPCRVVGILCIKRPCVSQSDIYKVRYVAGTCYVIVSELVAITLARMSHEADQNIVLLCHQCQLLDECRLLSVLVPAQVIGYGRHEIVKEQDPTAILFDGRLHRFQKRLVFVFQHRIIPVQEESVLVPSFDSVKCLTVNAVAFASVAVPGGVDVVRTGTLEVEPCFEIPVHQLSRIEEY